jgi:hypothetical protein
MQQALFRSAPRGLPQLPERKAGLCGRPFWRRSSGKQQSSRCRAYVPGLDLIQQLASADGIARTALRLRPDLFLDSVPHTSIIQGKPRVLYR